MADLDSTSNHRQAEILEALRKAGGSARIQSLASALEVSDETIRRNLRGLVAGGLVQKHHGGARLVERAVEADLNTRLQEHAEPKRRIAAEVARLVEDGTSVFLDVGSTTSLIAEALQRHSGLSVVTNSVAVAYRLAMRNGNRVFFAGGELRANDGGSFGPEALAFVRNFRLDLAVISTSGICPQRGLMFSDLSEAQLARAMVGQSARCIVAADSRKFHRTAPILLGDPRDIDILVTDEDPPEELAAAARQWGTVIRVAR
ncbi:MAG: DeoR/GlpR family DNA-binding transcription regulator [Tabrizicola sp.]